MGVAVRPKRSLELSLRSWGWLALVFLGLSIVFCFLVPPRSWVHVLSGLAFVPVAVAAALLSLKARWPYPDLAILGVIVAEAALTTALLPTRLLGGGLDFFHQLNLTLIPTYLLLFAFRSRIHRWIADADAT